jgi:hypothetical protein
VTAPAGDALGGAAAARPDATSALTAPVADALGGAAAVPDSVVSGLTAPVAEAIAPASTALSSSIPPAAVPMGSPIDALGSPPASGLVSATPSSAGGSSLPFDEAFPINPTVLAQILASPETRLVLVGLFGAYAAGRASGVGMVDFSQPLLRSCTASVRLAFSPVRLIPCGRGASSSGKTLVSPMAASAAEVQPKHRGGEAALRTWFRPPSVAAGAPPAPVWWSVPRSDNVVLQLLAAVLATLSAAIAGVGGRRFVRGRAAGTNGYPRNP